MNATNSNNPINVLQLVASSHGGAATHLRDLALGLSPDEYKVTVAMSLDGGNVIPDDFTNAGLKFVPVDITSGFSWGEVQRLQSLIQIEQIDVVHMHGARSAMFGRLAAGGLKQRPKTVFSVHGFATPFYSNPKRFVYLSIERILQRLTDCTICVAQAEADLFLSFGLTKPDKTKVISYGIDVDRFAKPAPDLTALHQELDVGNGPMVMIVCRINVPRDFDSLLTAFEQVCAELSEARLLIVGDGPQRDEVEALIRDKSLTESVQIIGFRSDIPDLMALADVYTLTSYGWEGYPISTMEAQAAGTPVVVTDAGGSGEAVLHEETGLVVPKRDPDALANALLRLLKNSDLREILGQTGQVRAKAEFTRQHMIEKIKQVYEEIASS